MNKHMVWIELPFVIVAAMERMYGSTTNPFD